MRPHQLPVHAFATAGLETWGICTVRLDGYNFSFLVYPSSQPYKECGKHAAHDDFASSVLPRYSAVLCTVILLVGILHTQ